jgi:hypothetical protein
MILRGAIAGMSFETAAPCRPWPLLPVAASPDFSLALALTLLGFRERLAEDDGIASRVSSCEGTAFGCGELLDDAAALGRVGDGEALAPLIDLRLCFALDSHPDARLDLCGAGVAVITPSVDEEVSGAPRPTARGRCGAAVELCFEEASTSINSDRKKQA